MIDGQADEMIKAPNMLVFLLVLSVGTWLSPRRAVTQNPDGTSDESTPLQELRTEVMRGFSARINLLGFGIALQPVDSLLNPFNILKIPRYVAELDVRPDFTLNFRRLTLGVKPRLELRWQRWEDGLWQGDSEVEANVFVYEWLARYRLTNQLFVSYGLENLQWGPSYLLSPSNPFNRNNGQNNPRLLVPGLDYARLVWIPSYEWTVSFIANTGEGRLELDQTYAIKLDYTGPGIYFSLNGRLKLLRDFERTYAIKLDYTGPGIYFSLIGSYREDGEARGGFYVGWTVSEALLLHAEGSFTNEIDDTAILVGASYTLVFGPTITVEFFHNGSGCTLDIFVLCFVPGFGDAEPTDALVRQNYVLVQYVQTQIMDTLNLTLRGIQNFDDHSSRIIGIVGYELNSHTELFVIATGNIGGKNNEFSSLLDYSVMVGVSYTF